MNRRKVNKFLFIWLINDSGMIDRLSQIKHSSGGVGHFYQYWCFIYLT